MVPVTQCDVLRWVVMVGPVRRCEAPDSTVAEVQVIRVARVWPCKAEEWPIVADQILPPDGVERVAVVALVQPWGVTY